jgi:acyl carrier protein
MDRDDILAVVRSALAEALEVSEEAIGEGSRFKEDLEADSLDLVELLLEMERVYGFKVNDEEAAEILTVGDAVELILVKVDAYDGRTVGSAYESWNPGRTAVLSLWETLELLSHRPRSGGSRVGRDDQVYPDIRGK